MRSLLLLMNHLFTNSFFVGMFCVDLELIRSIRVVRLAKNYFGSVLQKTAVFRFGFDFTKLTAVSVFGSVSCTVCCLMSMTLEMTYICAELVQLIVSRSDSELEVQRYGMKKNILTVDPIVLQDELWMRQREKPSPNCLSRFLKTEPRKPSFRFLNFEFCSVRFCF